MGGLDGPPKPPGARTRPGGPGARLDVGNRPWAPGLCLVTDRSLIPGGDLVAVVAECLAAGLPAVQVREKDLGASDLATLCRRLVPLTRERNALLVVNDRVDVALAVGAGAVQRTGASLTVSDIRAVARDHLAIAASVHSVDDARDAQDQDADWVVFGPVYDTPSKRRYGAPQGVARLAEITGRLRIPVVAIGGITPERVREVREAGACGVAVVAAILAAPSPADATRRFLDALGATAADRAAALTDQSRTSASPRRAG